MNNPKYELVCGMEVHAELKTASKMFCGCKNDPFHAKEPNSYTCPVCLGMPGALPVANKKAIEWTIKLGLALGSKINRFSKFDRKHYFYPDLPKAYQISQYDIPFCVGGVVETSDGPVKLTRIHLEEDTGKLLHKKVNGKDVSLIDFNRSSVPLIEIVTQPDIKSAKQAAEYGRILRETIKFLDIGDCDMEQGGMRLEANVSVRLKGSKELPKYKTELKNINSFRFLEQAIEYEIERHIKLLESGQTPIQETRGWDQTKQKTFSQRSKEEAEDYRYFPDPDLPPIEFAQSEIEHIKNSLPASKSECIKRFETEYGISEKLTSKIFTSFTDVDHWESVAKLAQEKNIEPKKVVNAIINKQIVVDSTANPDQIVSIYLDSVKTQEVDQDEVSAIISKVLSENPDVKDKYKAGQKQIIGFVMGQVIRQLSTKPDPQEIRSLIENELASN